MHHLQLGMSFMPHSLVYSFPPRQNQEAYGTGASTDQGNVSYEIPSIQGVFKIKTPGGADNHTAEFAEVPPG